jgi:hypothetical protein
MTSRRAPPSPKADGAVHVKREKKVIMLSDNETVGLARGVIGGSFPTCLGWQIRLSSLYGRGPRFGRSGETRCGLGCLARSWPDEERRVGAAFVKVLS